MYLERTGGDGHGSVLLDYRNSLIRYEISCDSQLIDNSPIEVAS